jgi:hypothetical protein
MAFTSDEIQAAVERLIRTKSRRQYGSLGERDTQATFSDIQEAVAGTFMLTPEAPFYAVYLGSRVLLNDLRALSSAVLGLASYVRLLSRRPTEYVTTEALREAQAALLALETATRARAGGFRSLASVPAYQRFVSAAESFLKGPAQMLRSDGDIVPTAQEARTLVGEMLPLLKSDLARLTERATSLANAMEDYSRVSLADRVGKTVVQKARKTIQGHAETMEAGSQFERQAALRSATLDVLAAKAIITGLGSFQAPLEEKKVSGILLPYSDDTHPVGAAQLLTDTDGPYLLISDLTLAVDVDGEQIDLLLSKSYVPVLESSTETWKIHNAEDGVPANRLWAIKINGVLRTVTLLPDQLASAASVATQLDTALASYGLKATAVGQTGSQRVQITWEAWGTGTLEVVTSPANEVLGFVEGYVWQCRKTTADEICSEINGQTALVQAEPLYTRVFDDGEISGRTDPNTPPYVLRRGNTNIVVSGTAMRLNIDSTGLQVGDIIIPFDGGDFLREWTIDTVGVGYVEAVNDLVGTPTAATGVDFDIIRRRPVDLTVVVVATKSTGDITPIGPYMATIECATPPPSTTKQVLVRTGTNAMTLWDVISINGTTIEVESTSQNAQVSAFASLDLIPDMRAHTAGRTLTIDEGPLAGHYRLKANTGPNVGELYLEDVLLDLRLPHPDRVRCRGHHSGLRAPLGQPDGVELPRDLVEWPRVGPVLHQPAGPHVWVDSLAVPARDCQGDRGRGLDPLLRHGPPDRDTDQ